MKTLRPYQTAAVEFIRRLRGQWRVALQAPTGSGKTIIMAELLRDPRRQLIVSHRRVLLDQIARTLDGWGIPFTFRAAGYEYNPQAIIALAMVQTELRRKPMEDVDILHVDEIHCMRGPRYKETFERYREAGASILGYTATPSDLGDMIDRVYEVVGVRELIAQGHLCPPHVYGCGQPDVRLLEKLRTDAQGEYLAGDVEKLVKPPVIFGPVVEHYNRLTNGTPFVLFASCVKTSRWWAQHLTGYGIPTAHIDGNNVWLDGEFHKSDSAKRAEIFRRLESGELAGVSNRFVLREGWDCPAVGHAILTCPFATRKTWTQACGRVLRPFAGKQYAVIQDHTGSCIHHPPLDSDEPWDWQAVPGLAEKIRIGEMRNDTTPEPIVCPKCMGVRQVGDTCPYCGFKYAKRARYVIQVDGKLRFVEGKSYRARKTQYKPGDAKKWERAYWAAMKHKPKRNGKPLSQHCTFKQVYARFAYNNNWQWLPLDLPLMPKYEGDWYLPVTAVPRERLRS